MTASRPRLAGLPGHQLLARLQQLVRRGNAAEAELLAHLGEVDARRQYLDQACSSMFRYCQRVLHFAEGVAYKRIQAARAARRHPEILQAVGRGDLHVTGVSLLAPQLTDTNCAELIRAARHRSADEIRRLLADRQPKPSVPTSVRPLPVRATLATPSAPPQRAITTDPPARTTAPPTPPPAPRTEPLGGERYCVRFTADQGLYAQLEELRALMRHQVPDGDLAVILGKAVGLLLAEVRKRRFGDCEAPRAARPAPQAPSRQIPAALRRAVVARDGEGCSYVSASGRRCGAREFLEFHHRDPWARTRSHSAEAIALYCRAHNQHAARRDFGDDHMARFGRRTPGHPSRTAATSLREPDLDPVRGDPAR